MALPKKYIQLALCSFMLCVSCKDSSTSVPGYIEGEYTYISSGVSGTLFNLYVNRGQPVHKGDVLYALDLQPETAKVEASKANIGDLQAQVVYAKVQLARQKALYPKNASTQADLDLAQQTFDSKTQELAANKAALIQNLWALNQKTQYAPKSGSVFDVFYRIGEQVEENHPVLAILAPENIKVLFYIPEETLSKIKLGQDITFSCDSCEKATHAKISYISPEAEFTPPVIYSKDTRYKLVYLIRADMPADVAAHFHPGQPIDVSLQP